MKGAKEIRYRRGRSRGDDAVEVTHEAAEKSAPKTMPQSLDRTPSESRMLRDLVWLILHRRGLSPTEIELACKEAYRDRSVISRRLPKIAAHYDRLRRAEES